MRIKNGITYWGNKRYFGLDYYLKEKFGEKVSKLNIDAGFGCPNRDGTTGYLGCLFCSDRGSGDFCSDKKTGIPNQIEQIKQVVKAKWRVKKFIAYFQPFSNTYDTVENLKIKYSQALRDNEIVGIAISTRADCISDEIIDYLYELSKTTFLWVEIGLQTANEKTRALLNIGYNIQQFESAYNKLKEKKINTVLHLIFGLPGETKLDMLNSVQFVSALTPFGVKFHQLMILKQSILENWFFAGKVYPLSIEEYSDIICSSISILDKNIVIHRLMSDSSEDLLLEPKWSHNKIQSLNTIEQEIKRRGLYQSIYQNNIY